MRHTQGISVFRIALAVLALPLAVPGSRVDAAFAAPPPTPTIQGLKTSIASLVPGQLSATNAAQLNQILDTASLRISQGQNGVAASLLRTFNLYVNRYVLSAGLPAVDANALLNVSNILIAGLVSVSTGLLSHYKLDEGAGTFTDDAAGAVNGTLVNGASWTPNGVRGKALSLNGASQFVDLGSSPPWPTGFAARSISGWGRSTTVAGGFRWIISYGFPTNSGSMFLGMNGNTLFGGGYGNDLVVGGLWDTGNWHHVALTYNGSIATMYFDGVQVASNPMGWNLSHFAASLGRQTNLTEFWEGDIDEVRVYNRALTAAEVAVLASR